MKAWLNYVGCKQVLFAVILFLSFDGYALADAAKDREIQACLDRANSCSSQCEGLSNRTDEIEKGFFSDNKTSPRKRCKDTCEKPCEKYLPYLIGGAIESLSK